MTSTAAQKVITKNYHPACVELPFPTLVDYLSEELKNLILEKYENRCLELIELWRMKREIEVLERDLAERKLPRPQRVLAERKLSRLQNSLYLQEKEKWPHKSMSNVLKHPMTEASTDDESFEVEKSRGSKAQLKRGHTRKRARKDFECLDAESLEKLVNWTPYSGTAYKTNNLSPYSRKVTSTPVRKDAPHGICKTLICGRGHQQDVSPRWKNPVCVESPLDLSFSQAPHRNKGKGKPALNDLESEEEAGGWTKLVPTSELLDACRGVDREVHRLLGIIHEHFDID